ncbi:5'/3'-nucleotidase SurE, partial [Streptomyces daliensis]|nr:5'/3'-nucleotidase SurE [Streptomyces daliensis]
SGVAGARPAEPESRVRAEAGLRVLVSNDDGYRHPYIRLLAQALRRAGHEAVIVAPDGNRSGSGTGVNYERGATVRAEETGPGVWSVSGSPGDAVAFGIQHVFAGDPPDLVVSGVNPGPNTGPTANHSGTVGATVAAQELGVPALAVSAGVDLTSPDDPFPSAPLAADFAARTVDRLARTAGRGALLPAYTALNVNVPAKPDGGVAFTHLGRAQEITREFVPAPDTCATCYTVSVGLDPSAPEPVGGADTSALRAGDVSLSLLTGDWGAPGWARGERPPDERDVRRTRARLAGLHP